MSNGWAKLIGVMLIAGTVSGCVGRNAEPVEEAKSTINGTITFLTHRTDIADTTMMDYVAAFKRLYPEADVKIEAVKDQSNILRVRAASGQLPDVTFIGGDTIQPKDFPRFFAPLDDLGLNGKAYFQDQFTVDGKVYAVTSGGTMTGIIYNKTAFEKAGISGVPRTIDEFLAACAKLKAAGIVPVATNFMDKWPLNYYESMAQAIEGDAKNVLDQNAERDAPFAEDLPYGKALNLLRLIVDKKYAEADLFSTNWEQSKKDLATGSTAMALLGNWAIQQVVENGAKPEDIGFFPMPTDNSGKLTSPIGSDAALAVNKDSEHIETAKAWVEFLVEQSGYDNDSGLLPALKATKSHLKQIADFMASGVVLIESSPKGEYASKVINKAQFAWADLAQEYAVASDPQSVLDAYNERWAKARAAIGK
ncbi:ABC transporter substrate-binding protein [Cohnella yongneupensis]|uniref:ABC transporter substrate-binding protein n=1 Tax=Cohnella yongneupensis TaxID=425006 RepID=A0ABW0QY74_9BACL